MCCSISAVRVVRVLGMLCVIAALVLGHHSTALAQAVPTYTGCYNHASGNVSKMLQGPEPLSSCHATETKVSFSAGDITKISVEGGLSGGGDNGDITIRLDAKYSLPQGCFAQAIAKWNGTEWLCSLDEDTQYGASTGLDLSTGLFSIEPSYRLPQNCTDGQMPARNGASWSCVSAPPPLEAWTKYVGGAGAPLGGRPEVIRLNLPAGIFVVTFSGLAGDDTDGNDEFTVDCTMNPGNAAIAADAESAYAGWGTLATQRILTFAEPGAVTVRCGSSTGSDSVYELVLTAVKIGKVNVQ